MSKIIWDTIGSKIAESGIDNGVLYPIVVGAYGVGVPWNGLTSVNEAPTGAEASPFYADNQKYLEIMSDEEFAGTIGCYTYPDKFKSCIGEAEMAAGVSIGQQRHGSFGLCYRTKIFNDTEGVDYGYKIHLVYGALAGVAPRAHATFNESPELEELSFDFTATKVPVTGAKPTAHLVIDSTKILPADASKLAALEAILYGAVGVDPRLPLPDEVASIFEEAAPSALALSSITPDSEPAAINANIVMTFNNKILSEAVVVSKSDGTIVAGSKAWDATGKILTFNPESDLANAATYIVAIGGVVDIYSQTLAAVVKSFTTVAA